MTHKVKNNEESIEQKEKEREERKIKINKCSLYLKVLEKINN